MARQMLVMPALQSWIFMSTIVNIYGHCSSIDIVLVVKIIVVLTFFIVLFDSVCR
jgi:hypothetical protein